MINEIITGALSGLAYSITGWKAENTDFDWVKLGKSVVISAIVGAICGATGMDFNVMIVGSMGIGVTALVNKIIKIFNKE